MGRSRHDFIERTGGYRIGETEAEFDARVAEIERLEGDIRGRRVSLPDMEKVQRRLCELKGIDFDGYDDPEDD